MRWLSPANCTNTGPQQKYVTHKNNESIIGNISKKDVMSLLYFNF